MEQKWFFVVFTVMAAIRVSVSVFLFCQFLKLYAQDQMLRERGPKLILLFHEITTQSFNCILVYITSQGPAGMFLDHSPDNHLLMALGLSLVFVSDGMMIMNVVTRTQVQNCVRTFAETGAVDEDWFIRHRYWVADTRKSMYVVIVAFFVCFLTVCGAGAVALGIENRTTQHWFLAALYVVLLGSILLFIIFLNYKLVKTSRNRLDAFGVRQDVKTIFLVAICVSICTVPPWIYQMIAPSEPGASFVFIFAILLIFFYLFFECEWFLGRYIRRSPGFVWCPCCPRKYNDLEGNQQRSSCDFRDLKAILKSRDGFDAFFAHLMLEYASENLIFFRDLNKFWKNHYTSMDSRYTFAEFQKLCALYFEDSSPLQVNVSSEAMVPIKKTLNLYKHLNAPSSSQVKDLRESVESCRAMLSAFDIAINEILRLMHKDSFFRFQRSALSLELKKKLVAKSGSFSETGLVFSHLELLNTSSQLV